VEMVLVLVQLEEEAGVVQGMEHMDMEEKVETMEVQIQVELGKQAEVL